ncbi:HAD hydrolase-like protein [Mesorhizobium shangrilense]|uniref:HAD hydrolase-like protein n=1 Tax=Mesorhizobium shangrilense TaxID=460060 RepID=A0ABV2DTK5_9HYPH
MKAVSIGLPTRPDLLGYERHEVLAVGDSLRTDVAGGRNVGMDVLFVANGIHRDAAGDLGDRASLWEHEKAGGITRPFSPRSVVVAVPCGFRREAGRHSDQRPATIPI